MTTKPEATVTDTEWRWSRNAPGFSQRFTGTFSADGNIIDGLSQLDQDGTGFKDDLKITYRRQA